MSQEPIADNNLQKAIDDITNSTNVDPVFSDPVAAPSTIPEGDTGELDEPVGPFPEPKVEMVPPAPEPIAPLEPIDVSELQMPTPPEAPEAAPVPPAPEPLPSTPEPVAPEVSTGLNTRQIKEAALRDLVPLMDHLSLTPSQKFNMYRNIFEELKDYTVLESAYHAASEIPDEQTRAEALLYLVEAIDKM